MSYVIQNFADLTKKPITTPRFKFFFFLINIDKFFIFLKFNNFLNFNKIQNSLTLSYSNLFIKSFFSKSYIKIINNLNFNFTGFYLNNLIKSYVFLFFKTLSLFLKFNTGVILTSNYKHLYLYKFYLMPIKTLNIKVNDKLFKNLFFYFMFFTSSVWYQHTSFFNFYLNFIIVNSNLKINRFFNTYFLKIYNY